MLEALENNNKQDAAMEENSMGLTPFEYPKR